MSWNACPDPVLGQRETVDAIDTLIVPRAVDLGEMTVRRALPSVERQMVGPFIFFDQMGPAEFLTDQGIDVRPHPHINLSTLTYLFEGQILHRDSLGTEITIEPGEINWMTAGKGIVHSERTTVAKKASGQKLFGLQTWMALPEEKEETSPNFRHFGKEELPIVEDRGIRVRLIAGAAFGGVSPLNAPSETLYADIRLDAGTAVPIDPTVEERALYTINGDVEIDGETYSPGQLIVLRSSAALTVKAKKNSRLMLFGGAPMEGPRYIWWNFVSSRLDRIEQAKEEWARGRFDTVPGDEEEFIPLPADVGKPRKAFGGQRE
ncbi:MAG: pirin family protein [Pseudomonadota bacterium]